MMESSPAPVNPCSGVPPLNRMQMSVAAIPEIPLPSDARTTTFKREFKRRIWVPSWFGHVRAFAIAAAPSVGVVRDPDWGTKYDRVVLGTFAWAAGALRAVKRAIRLVRRREIHGVEGRFMVVLPSRIGPDVSRGGT